MRDCFGTRAALRGVHLRWCLSGTLYPAAPQATSLHTIRSQESTNTSCLGRSYPGAAWGHFSILCSAFLISCRPSRAGSQTALCFFAHSRAVPGSMATRVPPLKEGSLSSLRAQCCILHLRVMDGSWHVVQLSPMWLACWPVACLWNLCSR